MRRRGTSLVEVLASVVVLGVTASVVFPLLSSVADAQVGSSSARTAHEDVRFAMQRVRRLLREVPAGENDSEVGISSAAEDGFELTDGTGARLREGTLELLQDGEWLTLLEGVDAFEIGYLGKDGVTSTLLTPASTQRCTLMLSAGGIVVWDAAFCRTRVGNP